MSHPINTEIFENLIENYQIFKVTLEDNVGIYTKFAIRDENGELVRHNNMSFFPIEEDAKRALNEIINQKFEELSK